MRTCPHCDVPLPEPIPAICAGCGQTLGDPPRRGAAPSTPAPAAPAVAKPAARPVIGSVWDVLLLVATLGLGWFWLAARRKREE